MNVLVLNQWNVYPPTSGGAHAVYELCSGIASRHDCVLACWDENIKDASIERIGNGLVLARLPSESLRGKHLRFFVPNVFFRDNAVKLSLRSRFSNAMRERLQPLVDVADVIIVSHPWVWPLLKRTEGWGNKPFHYTQVFLFIDQ